MTWPSSSLRRSADSADSEPPIGDLKARRLVQRTSADLDPVRDPFPKEVERDLRLSQRGAALVRVTQESDRSFGVDEHRLLSKSLPEPFCCFPHRDSLGTGHIQDSRRARAELEAAERIAVRVTLPDRIEEPDGQIDRVTGEDPPGDVDQGAIAEI